MTVEGAAKFLGATPADIAGLWNLPGHPELTSNQLLQIAGEYGYGSDKVAGHKATFVVVDEYFKLAP